MRILTTDNKQDEKFLRKKVAVLDFAKESKKELREIIKEMRKTMIEAGGIGLSANQIGLSKRLFVAQLPSDDESAPKFYVIINPKITKKSEEISVLEEGCLSIPEVFGLVERPEKIIIEGLDARGKKLKIKAWGLLGRVFQHETDHLDGILFTDKATNLRKIELSREKGHDL